MSRFLRKKQDNIENFLFSSTNIGIKILKTKKIPFMIVINETIYYVYLLNIKVL